MRFRPDAIKALGLSAKTSPAAERTPVLELLDQAEAKLGLEEAGGFAARVQAPLNITLTVWTAPARIWHRKEFSVHVALPTARQP